MNKKRILTMSKKRILVAGWFSFPDRHATFGDVQAMQVVTQWLTEEGFDYDIVENTPTGTKSVSLENINLEKYKTLIFICGPWFNSFDMFGKDFAKHFSSCFKIGINLSVTDEKHGFDLLLPRDFFTTKNPDLVFAAKSDNVPVVGLFLVHSQEQYGNKQRHDQVKKAVLKYIETEGHALIELDTLIENNPTGISNASQLQSLIRKCDYIISSRLHGTVYSLKNNVPVLAIDCVKGGAKVTAQANAVKWPAIINGDGITVDGIKKGVQIALDNKKHIDTLKINALKDIEKIHNSLIEGLNNGIQTQSS